MARADTRLEPAPKIPPMTALRTLARVGRFLRPYRREILLAAIASRRCGVRGAGCRAGSEVRRRSRFRRGDARELDRMLALMLGVIVVMAGATYMRFYHVSWLGERVTADLRRAVFDHLLDLPPSFFEATRTGEVISRLINDTTMLETVIGSSASMAIRNVLLMIGGLVMLTLTSPKLTLLVLAGVPLVVVPIILFGRRVRNWRERRRTASATSAPS
jgi:ATP-binding cassette subfamily B protein